MFKLRFDSGDAPVSWHWCVRFDNVYIFGLWCVRFDVYIFIGLWRVRFGNVYIFGLSDCGV